MEEDILRHLREFFRGNIITKNNVNNILTGVLNKNSTPLNISIIMGRDDIMEYLIEIGADINLNIPYIHTPLVTASIHNNYNAISLLLKLGALPNAINFDGMNALGISFLYNDHAITNLLMAYGADINFDDGVFEHTPFYTFINNSNIENVVEMFERGLDLTRSPYPNLGFVLNRFVPLYQNNRGYNLMFSVEKITYYISYLLQKGISPDINYEGKSPLIITTMFSDNFDILSLTLLQYGASIDSNDKMIFPPDLIELDRINTFRYIVVNGLIDVNAPVYYHSKNNKNLLRIACALNKPSFIDLLLEYGADPNNVYRGQSLISKFVGKPHIFKKLIKAGANPNIEDNFGRTPLILASQMEEITNIKNLLNGGANINHQNPNTGETALIVAVKSNSFRVVRLLLDNNANANIRDFNGKTAVDYINSRDKKLLKILRKNM